MPEPWIQDTKGFSPFLWGSNNSIKEKQSCSTVYHGTSEAMFRSSVARYVLSEWTFQDKSRGAWRMSVPKYPECFGKFQRQTLLKIRLHVFKPLIFSFRRTSLPHTNMDQDHNQNHA